MNRGRKRQQLLDRLYNQDGLSLRQIAEKLGQGITTIHTWMEEEGIQRRGPGRASERPPQAELQAAWEKANRQLGPVARRYNKTADTIREWLRDYGLWQDEPPPTKATRATTRWQYAADFSTPAAHVIDVKKKGR